MVRSFGCCLACLSGSFGQSETPLSWCDVTFVEAALTQGTVDRACVFGARAGLTPSRPVQHCCAEGPTGAAAGPKWEVPQSAQGWIELSSIELN